MKEDMLLLERRLGYVFMLYLLAEEKGDLDQEYFLVDVSVN